MSKATLGAVGLVMLLIPAFIIFWPAIVSTWKELGEPSTPKMLLYAFLLSCMVIGAGTLWYVAE